MAIYHFSVKVISRARGRSVLAAAAYRSAGRLHDERLDRDHDFTDKAGVIHSEILLPEGVPDRLSDRERLWNEVEAVERRKDAQLAREVEFAIPREMSQPQGIALAQDFVRAEFVAKGMIADLNVHWDVGADGLAKPHAHVLLTLREVGEEGFGRKVRDWNATRNITKWRERWADHINLRLAELDIDARVDHRSFEAQGIELEPQDKIGPAARRRDERGLESERVEDHRAIARRNGERIISDPSLAVDAITYQQATFTRRDMAAFVHRHTDGKEQFDRVMGVVRAAPDLVALGRDGRGEDRFTSREMIETEYRLQRTSETMAARELHAVDEKDRAVALAHSEQSGLALIGEQRAAFEHATAGQDLGVVVGYAGAGKSAMLGTARIAWERVGFDVRGLALSGIAAEGLENGSGIASRTIASMEHAWSQGRDRLTSRDVLVIDEAGMVGTRQMARVLSHAADAGAKVLLVGDPQQLQAIEAGAAFRAIFERHGGIEITQVRRQTSAWQQNATRHLATGRTGEAIRSYSDRGMVHAADTRDEARHALVDHWDRDRIAAPDQSRTILTHTNDEVRALNEVVRDRMRQAGQLGDDVHVETERGARSFSPGDRIMFLRNERNLAVKNGTLGTVEKVSSEHIAVRTDDGRSVAFDTKAYANVDHGYAVTIHKAQGMTVDKVYMLATPGMDRHAAYVGMSRHRDSAQLHFGRDDFDDESRLIRILSREREKDMATDYAPIDLRQQFAERRGIRFEERVGEFVRALPDKARGIFARFRPPTQKREPSIFSGFRPPERSVDETRIGPPHATGQQHAVERYAQALEEIVRMREKRLPILPHQREALDRAGSALDAVRSHAAADLGTVFQRQPELIRQTAKGHSQAAVQAMKREADLRADPFRRADRFVEGWRHLRHALEESRRDGDLRGAARATREMAGMTKGLEGDMQMAALLLGRGPELGVDVSGSRSLARALAASVSLDHGRDNGRDKGRSR